MANYTAADIKEIRELLGSGMMDVKKALDEADGDKQKAIEILRVKGAKAAAKRGERVTAEGLVVSKIVDGKNGKVGYLAELDCETDFVAKSDDFIKLANQVIEGVVSADADSVDSALKASVDGNTVEELIGEAAGTRLRENLKLANVGKVEGEIVAQYMHKKDMALPPYVGVMVAGSGVSEDNLVKIAQHLTSNLSVNGTFPYTSIEDVPAETIEAEERVAREKNAGKPDNIMPKIIQGSLNKFYKENVLLEQNLVFDDSVSIKSLLGDGEITGIVGFVVGGENK
ncbi:MAG: translation elongation factor Ts [Candidatus Ancillula sp.]|jgi:elongation factor Ts|nr:translation elongation factor Ts [Candidatus Ancillula sp.]